MYTARKYYIHTQNADINDQPEVESTPLIHSTCFEDINQILSVDRCFDQDEVLFRRMKDRHKLETSFWERDRLDACMNKDYELIGFTHGVHILVGAQPIQRKHNHYLSPLYKCPIVVVDAAPSSYNPGGNLYKHALLIYDGLTNEEKKKSYSFHNQMALKHFRDAVENARAHVNDIGSHSYDFMSDNCATFGLDIIAELGIDYKGLHRKAITASVVRGFMSSEETTNKVMDVIRMHLKGGFKKIIWRKLLSLQSEEAVLHHFVTKYIDRHKK